MKIERLTRVIKKSLKSGLLLFYFCFIFSQPVYAAVFTAGMAKRDAPGPFMAAPIVQGDPNNRDSLTDDVLAFDRGTQIDSNFYSNLDTRQGSVVFWWTPEYSYDSLSGTGDHYLYYFSSNYYLAYEYDNDQYIVGVGTETMTVPSNIVAGTTYSLVVRWDTSNKLDGTNYVSFSINDSHTLGVTTQPTVSAPDSTIYVGSDGTSVNVASGIIEGLTVYRRPLYDGSNGIDVGNGDEIVAIYNSDLGADPTLTTGSWDVVFALPTNSLTGVLTSGTGEAWSHPHSSNLIPGNSGTGGFMMNGTYASDGWALEGWYNTDWSYRKEITILAAKVEENLTNFPVLISWTDSEMKDIGNSGNVGQSDGGDIVFTNASGQKLDHEIELYVPSTGQLIAWVEVDAVSSSTNTDILVYYGNESVGDQWDINGTWDSNYQAVYHLKEVSGGRSDATSKGNNLIDYNTVTQTDGKIGKAADFDNSQPEVLYQSDGNLSSDFPGKVGADVSEGVTVSTWIKRRTGSPVHNAVLKDTNPNFLWVGSDGVLHSEIDASSPDSEALLTSTTTWYHIAMVWTGTELQLYVNAVASGSPVAKASFPETGTFFLLGGRANLATNRALDGSLDEVRISNKARSTGWMLTEFNNQDDPLSFYSVGDENAFLAATVSVSEKIFAGGYQVASETSDEGIYQDMTVSAGDDWVIRALAHSDGTSIPKLILYDQTNGAEIGSLTGTNTSTRADPDVFIFTGEAPAGSTTLRVKLVNTQTSGVTYWHQVEVLANGWDDPSIETGTSPNDIGSPTSSAQSSDQTHSDTNSWKVVSSSTDEGIKRAITSTSGNFYGMGGWVYAQTSGTVDLKVTSFVDGSTTETVSTDNDAWKHLMAINRALDTTTDLEWQSNDIQTFYVDDVYSVGLDNVILTVASASKANSTENTDEIRVDGRDTYVETAASSLGTAAGYAGFDYRPRHSAATASSFDEGSDDAYIFSLTDSDNSDYVNLFWDSVNIVKLAVDTGSGEFTDTWDATSVVVADTQYAVVLQYTNGGNVTVSFAGTERFSIAMADAFDEAPDDVYFGSDYGGDAQGDATFSDLVFDNTAPAISLTALSPDPNNDTTPSVTGTATEAIGTVSTIEYQMDGTSGSWTACTADDGTIDEVSEAFTCTPSALSEGSQTIYIRATDSNGNTTSGGSESSDAFTIDSIASVVSLMVYTPDPGSDITPTVVGTITDATTVLTAIEYQMDGTSGSWTACTADDGTIDEVSEAFSCTPQTLNDGAHTMYLRSTDEAGNTTLLADYAADTFMIDTTPPIDGSAEYPGEGSYINNTRPTFRWKAFSDTTAGMSDYRLEVDNGDTGDFTIDGIPVSRTTDYETNKYRIVYEGFEDGIDNNEYITLYTKSSSEWSDSQNDGQLKTGRRSWTIRASDNVGNNTSSGRSFWLDNSSPTLSSSIDNLGSFSNYQLVTSTNPTIFFELLDTLVEDKVEIGFYRQSFFLGIESNRTLFSLQTIHNTDTGTTNTSWSDSLTSSQALDYGKYLVEIRGYDKAGNSTTNSINLQVLTVGEANLWLFSDVFDEVEEEVIDEENDVVVIKEVVSIPEMEKKVRMRREEVAEGISKTISLLISFLKGFKIPKLNVPSISFSFDSVEEEIAQTYRVTTERIGEMIRGFNLAFMSIKKPMDETVSFFQRTKIWFSTFNAIVIDRDPTQISEVVIEEMGRDLVIVSWKTNHLAWGKVNYGTDLTYGQEVILTERSTYHQVKLTNIKPNTKYFFEVMSQGKNYVYDAYYSFEINPD